MYYSSHSLACYDPNMNLTFKLAFSPQMKPKQPGYAIQCLLAVKSCWQVHVDKHEEMFTESNYFQKSAI